MHFYSSRELMEIWFKVDVAINLGRFPIFFEPRNLPVWGIPLARRRWLNAD